MTWLATPVPIGKEQRISFFAQETVQCLLFVVSPPEYLVGTDAWAVLSNCGFAVVNCDFSSYDTPFFFFFSPKPIFALTEAYCIPSKCTLPYLEKGYQDGSGFPFGKETQLYALFNVEV